MKCIISWMVHNRSFEAGWGRPNCSSDCHRSLVPFHQAVYKSPWLAVWAQQVHTLQETPGSVTKQAYHYHCERWSGWRWAGFGVWDWGVHISLLIFLMTGRMAYSLRLRIGGWRVLQRHHSLILQFQTRVLVWVIPKAATELRIWQGDCRKSRWKSREEKKATSKCINEQTTRAVAEDTVRTHLRIIP